MDNELFLFSSDEEIEPFGINTIFDTVKTIVALGLEKDFLEQCNERGLEISVSAELANFTKEFLPDQEEPSLSSGNPIARGVARNIRKCRHPDDCR